MTSLPTSLRSLPKRQAGGPNGTVTTEATLAHVLVSKYADHLPLYRQAQIVRRHMKWDIRAA